MRNLNSKNEEEEEYAFPPEIVKGAKAGCENCAGKGKYITEFVRTRSPRMGKRDWDGVVCECVPKQFRRKERQ